MPSSFHEENFWENSYIIVRYMFQLGVLKTFQKHQQIPQKQKRMTKKKMLWDKRSALHVMKAMNLKQQYLTKQEVSRFFI